MATSSDERVCAKPGCHTPIPDDGTTCPNCGEFVDLPDIDYEAPTAEALEVEVLEESSPNTDYEAPTAEALEVLEESSPRYFSKKRKKQPVTKLSTKDQDLVKKFFGQEDPKATQLSVFRI